MNPAIVGYIDLQLVHPQDASWHGREPWNGLPLPARVRSGAEMGAEGDSLSSPIGKRQPLEKDSPLRGHWTLHCRSVEQRAVSIVHPHLSQDQQAAKALLTPSHAYPFESLLD